MNHEVIYKAAKDKFGIDEATIDSDEYNFVLTSNLGKVLTNADFTQAELDAAEQALIVEKEAAKAQAAAVKQALLDKLGITAEEAKLLLS